MKKVRIVVFALLLCAFFALSTGCGGKTQKDDNPKNTIEIVESSVTINRFQTEKLTLSESNGNEKWSSTDSDIVSVENGILTGKAAGNATITCEVDGMKDTCFVIVKDSGFIPVIETGLTVNEININKGQTFQLDPHIKFMDKSYDDGKFNFTASNNLIDIKENNDIIGINEGAVTLYITGVWNGFTMPSLNTIIKINVVNI